MTTQDALEKWLADLSELRWAEVLTGDQKRWCVRLYELNGEGRENQAAEAEDATLDGAIQQALNRVNAVTQP